MEMIDVTQKKNTFNLFYAGQKLTLSGDFDSGNLNWAGLSHDGSEIMTVFGKDRDIKTTTKCWFYFSIQCRTGDCLINLHLLRVNSLTAASKVFDIYRPVLKEEGSEWHRHYEPVDIESTPEGDINLRMKIQVNCNKKLLIALCYPWSYAENLKYLENIDNELKFRKDLYYNRQTLIHSPQGRQLHLLALSSPDIAQEVEQDYLQNLFPNKHKQKHLKAVKKPLILITARVHPGEIGSSHAFKGMVEYLISGKEEAKKILKQFYILMVPMLNPDGVFLGNNRMDCFQQNLNRYYHLPDLEKQPSCYAIKSIVENTRKQLYAFFDLHGHANKKSCFIFGNSIPFTRMQIQSVLYAKYLCSICQYLQFKSCNFSKKQMSSKDKNQQMSKQGCARVVVLKWSNSPFCYTLQTGLYKNVTIDEKGIERYGDKFYTPEIYAQVGWKMISALFKVIGKGKILDQLRKESTDYVNKLEKLNNKKQKPKTTKNIKKDKIETKVQAKFEGTSLKTMKQKGLSQGRIVQAKKVEQALQNNKNKLLNMDDQDD